MTTTTHRTAAALLAGTALLLAGCASTTTTDTAATTSSGPDRTNPQAVADAFADAWAGGDLTTACSYTAGDAQTKLTGKGLCKGTATWRQTPSHGHPCAPSSDGSVDYPYELNGSVDGFDSFMAEMVKQSNGQWSVQYLFEGDRGEKSVSCINGYASASPGTRTGTTG